MVIFSFASCTVIPTTNKFLSTHTPCIIFLICRYLVYTGIDMSKILGEQTKIFWGQKMVKSGKCMGISQLLGGHMPGLPPKSTPMMDYVFGFL